MAAIDADLIPGQCKPADKAGIDPKLHAGTGAGGRVIQRKTAAGGRMKKNAPGRPAVVSKAEALIFRRWRPPEALTCRCRVA